MGALPGHAPSYLFEIHVTAVENDFADISPVAVLFVGLDDDGATRHEIRQGFTGTLPKGLRLLRCVDARQTYFVLYIARIQNRDGVSIRDVDDPARNLLSLAEGHEK